MNDEENINNKHHASCNLFKKKTKSFAIPLVINYSFTYWKKNEADSFIQNAHRSKSKLKYKQTYDAI